MVIRKTITFKPEIVREINKLRAEALLNSNLDISFTEMVNHLLKGKLDIR